MTEEEAKLDADLAHRQGTTLAEIRFKADIKELLDKMDKRLDTQEQLVANLVMAYTEMYAITESLMAVTLGTRSDEDQKAFMEQFQEFRKGLFQQIQDVSKHGLEGIDPELAESLARMVNQDPDPSTSERDMSSNP